MSWRIQRGASETLLQGANMEVFCLSLHCLHLPEVQTWDQNEVTHILAFLLKPRDRVFLLWPLDRNLYVSWIV